MANRKPSPGQTCTSCGRQANFQCSCGCGAAGCFKCKRERRIG